MKHYLRGQLAKAARLNKETLRYYENNGLIPPAQRDSNGYRYYPAETLVLLEFISVAKAAGFTLKEIKELFSALQGEEFQKESLESIIVKKLADAGIHAGYYKAALSGAESIEESDAGYVKKIAGITQEDSSLLSYLYQNAVSPHLAARIEGNPVDPETVKADFDRVKKGYDYVTVEGSGGIVCPIRWDEEHEILLEDIVKMLHLNTLVIADAGLGTINAVVLTVEYIRNHGMDVKGIILNHYSGGAMQEDNEKMIERLTGVPVIARVRDGDRELEVDLEVLKRVYD